MSYLFSVRGHGAAGPSWRVVLPVRGPHDADVRPNYFAADRRDPIAHRALAIEAAERARRHPRPVARAETATWVLVNRPVPHRSSGKREDACLLAERHPRLTRARSKPRPGLFPLKPPRPSSFIRKPPAGPMRPRPKRRLAHVVGVPMPAAHRTLNAGRMNRRGPSILAPAVRTDDCQTGPGPVGNRRVGLATRDLGDDLRT